jgi:hypothetical protein
LATGVAVSASFQYIINTVTDLIRKPQQNQPPYNRQLLPYEIKAVVNDTLKPADRVHKVNGSSFFNRREINF